MTEEIKITLDNTGEAVPAGGKKGFDERGVGTFLILLSFLLPVFFIPSQYFPLAFTKSILLSLVALVSFALWVLARLKDGKFVFPNSMLLVAGGAILLVALASSLFGGAPGISLVGQGFEVGTVSSLFGLMLLLFLTAATFRSKERIFYAYLAFFCAFFILTLFHLLRIFFGPTFFSFGLFTGPTANFVGQWNDLGIFFGFSAILSLVTLELITLRGAFRVFVSLTLLLSLFFLAIVNFSLVWIVLALFSLVFFVYLLSFQKENELAASAAPESFAAEAAVQSLASSRRLIPRSSLCVLLISLVFILGAGPIGNFISDKLGINQIEVRPSWTATYAIAQSTLAKNPLLGAGPNRFLNEWLANKPDGINATQFWNTDFSYGFGLLPTYLVTTGILGIISWLIFLGFFLFLGFRAVLSPAADPISRYLIASSFFGSLFLWIFNVFYVPSTVLVGLTFLFTGLFLATLYESNVIKTKTLSFADTPRTSFISVLLLIILLAGSVTLGYLFTLRYVSSVYFSRGIVAANVGGNIDVAEKNVTHAASISGNDLYFRFLTDIDLARMNAVLSDTSKNTSADSVRAKFQTLLGQALSDARAAISFDAQNYANFANLGRVYEAVVPLKISGAYENAAGAYTQALALNPASPALLLTRARLELTKGDNAKAKDFIVRAIQMKNNYTEAIFLLSQVQVAEGNLKDAINSAEAAASLAPNDSGVFFQLGVLRYNNKDYAGAADALSRALVLNPAYANAKYFLGLSAYQTGKVSDAVKIFADLKQGNPDNKEIELILTNLKAGKPPFTNVAPPIDAKPEKRKKLPVSEKTSVAPSSDSSGAGF